METYRVKVFTPGHKLVFKGKVVRSPVTFSKIQEKDLKLLENQVRKLSLKYEVVKEDNSPKLKPFPIEQEKSIIEDDGVKVEELELKEPSTILERLIYEEGNEECEK